MNRPRERTTPASGEPGRVPGGKDPEDLSPNNNPEGDGVPLLIRLVLQNQPEQHRS